MEYLLDTHTLIWSITCPANLSKKARDIIENSNSKIFVNLITLWEISLKFSIGKLYLDGITADRFPGICRQMGFKLIALSPEDGATYDQLMITPHKDLFDRMLIWQAINRNLVFISRRRH